MSIFTEYVECTGEIYIFGVCCSESIGDDSNEEIEERLAELAEWTSGKEQAVNEWGEQWL